MNTPKFIGFVDTAAAIHQINPALVESVTLQGGTIGKDAVVSIRFASGREICVAGFGGREDAVENCLEQLNA